MLKYLSPALGCQFIVTCPGEAGVRSPGSGRQRLHHRRGFRPPLVSGLNRILRDHPVHHRKQMSSRTIYNFLDQDKLLKNVQLVWCHRSNWKRSFIRPEIFWFLIFLINPSSEDQKKLIWLVPILPFSNQVNLVREPSLESKILVKIEPYIMPCPSKKLWAGRLWVNTH